MKVLWISVDPCGAKSQVGSKTVTGGWLASLEAALVECPDIELHEVYYSPLQKEDFVFNGVHNHPIYDDFCSTKQYFILNQLSLLANSLMHDRRVDRVIEAVERINPDIVHLHGTESALSSVAIHIKNIPVVVSIQGLLSPIRNKQYSGIPYEEVRKQDNLLKYLTLSHSFYGKKGWSLYTKRERNILSNCKYLIGRTDWDRRVTSILAPHAKYYIGNELLRSEFIQAKGWNKSVFNSELTIVSIITGGLFKGFETVLQTSALLKQDRINFKWVIIGQTSNSNTVTLFEKYTNIKCNSVNVECVGRKNVTELVTIMEQADIYCQVSHIENSPNSVCEAMMLGMPVIASFAGGTNTMITDKVNGFLYQPGEFFSLAGCIKELMFDFAKAKAMGEQARKDAMIRHNPDKVRDEYINIYKDILNMHE